MAQPELFAAPQKSAPVDLATDDWPFFYTLNRSVPWKILFTISIILIPSIVFFRRDLVSPAGWSWTGFLLGAAFMLIETKAITELALLLGNTSLTVASVISGILIMCWVGNLLTPRLKNCADSLAFGLLIASVSFWFVVPSVTAAVRGTPIEAPLYCAFVGLPFIFAGLIFSRELERFGRADAVLGANLLGAIVGGLLEYFALFTGYRALVLLALLLYTAGFLARTRIGGAVRAGAIR